MTTARKTGMKPPLDFDFDFFSPAAPLHALYHAFFGADVDISQTEHAVAVSCGVDGEPAWGVDRLGQVKRWLAAGGW
jgi:2-hydroxychromene-2-carboxylate isomerase